MATMDEGAVASGKTPIKTSEGRSTPPSSLQPTPSSINSCRKRNGEEVNQEILLWRKELSKLVLGLSEDPPAAAKTEAASQNLFPSLEKVAEILDPFFDSIASSIKSNTGFDNARIDINESDTNELFRGVTPLVIACDKGNLACILYFCKVLERQAHSSTLRSTFWEALIGSPFKSKTNPANNTAFHHCTTEHAIKAEHKHKVKGESFLELLERIAIAQERLGGSDKIGHNKEDYNFILAFGEAVNSNGDTPLMMAVANNVSLEDGTGTSSAKAFLERWCTLVLERSKPESLQSQIQRIQHILTAKNDDQRSILYYAWLGGIVDLIQWLIDIDIRNGSSSMPIITSEETLLLREYTEVIRKTIQSNTQNNKNVTDEYKKKQRAVQEKKLMISEECTKLLEAHVQKCSEQMAQQLLEELEGGENDSVKPKRKKKKKKKKQQHQQTHGEQSVDNECNKERLAGTDISDGIDNDLLHLTKLTNGKLAVTVPGQQEEDDDKLEKPQVLPSAWYRKRTFSLDETNQLLRDRYKEGSTKSISATPTPTNGKEAPRTMTTTPKTPNESSDADSVLSALCLDVNCLLYSDHGMALNLSPAQLDAVEQILREQLQSVAKARLLQERRCRSAATPSSLVSNTTEREETSNINQI